MEERDIRDALEKGRIIPYFQPQYDAITGKLKGAEALARIVTEDGRIVPPCEFIPEAEKSDLICDIDWTILEASCAFLQKRIMSRAKTVRISSNFSRRHLGEYSFLQRLKDTVDKYAIPHKLIVVEITESFLAGSEYDVVRFVSDIRNEDFGVAIDDFGSGLSSLSFMKDVDANTLKIDRSLLSGNCQSEKERTVLESIFMFAQRLRMATVAEGVETEEQLGFLRTCGCSQIQGFIFNKPMPESEFSVLCSTGEYGDNWIDPGDVLKIQAQSTTTELLVQAVFRKFPLIIYANLTRNSYYMLTYAEFTAQTCSASGAFDDLIAHGASTIHEEDRAEFARVFSRQNLFAEYEKGNTEVRLVSRQRGDDGIYRRVETTDYFVKSESSDDLLVVSLNQNLEEIAAETDD
ncbi:MAG: EAL domain-containing protein [Lachnospiraceae bacterium]|nr:EAL domain-containing protein [Lachnospiraceae bacterium]